MGPRGRAALLLGAALALFGLPPACFHESIPSGSGGGGFDGDSGGSGFIGCFGGGTGNGGESTTGGGAFNPDAGMGGALPTGGAGVGG